MVGELIRFHRTSSGLSLSTLADRSGVSRSYLYQIERGECSPTVDKLVKLALGLDVPAANLLPSKTPPLACLDCGLLYRNFALDATLPDDQWRMIHDSDGGILCANCIIERAVKLPGAVAIRMRIEFSQPDGVPTT